MADTNEEVKQPGTVQGSTTDIISNQQGVDINHDGDDKKILENYDAEKITDEINSIKTISNAEYLELPDEKKKDYVVYNPGLTDAVFYQWLALQTQLVNGFNTLGPAIEKMNVLENITFLSAIAENLSAIAESVAAVPESVAGLSSALSKVGLGKLIDIITSLAKGLGALSALVIANMLNPFANIRAYYTAYQQIDFTSLKTLLEPQQGTPSIATMLARQQAQMNVMHFPSEEIKNKIGEQSNAIMNQLTDIANAYNSIQVIENLIKTVQEVDTLLSVAGSIMSFSVAGIAKEAFNEQYDTSFAKEHVDYKKKADKLTKQYNEFQKTLPIEWISKTDLAKLKELEHTQDVYEDQDGNGIMFPSLTTEYYSKTTTSVDGDGHRLKKYWRYSKEENVEYPVKLETIKVTTDSEGNEEEKVLKTEYYKKNASGEYELQNLREVAETKVANLTTLNADKEQELTNYREQIEIFSNLMVLAITAKHEGKNDVYTTKYADALEMVPNIESIEGTININAGLGIAGTLSSNNIWKDIWSDADTRVYNTYKTKYYKHKNLTWDDIKDNNS